ncbi:MAG: TetR/AcrR family transcriptional regulator [Spirochaetaceae bacterium]|jgi:AcrR family transcriptional regulator|nr:TetR/AcrR family transcriptional regulator [Spirochaetaceae bacterium]
MEKQKGKRRLQKEKTREHIMETALRVYAEQGFSVPVGMIAREAGLAHGSVFLHFPTTEDLLYSTLERFFKRLAEKTHALSGLNGELRTLLRGFLSIIEEHEAFYKHLIMEMHTLPPGTKHMLIALRSINAHHFGTAVKREIRRGRIKKLPPRLMFNTWMGMVYYYLQNGEWFAPGQSVIKRCKNDLVNSYIKLIRKDNLEVKMKKLPARNPL